MQLMPHHFKNLESRMKNTIRKQEDALNARSPISSITCSGFPPPSRRLLLTDQQQYRLLVVLFCFPDLLIIIRRPCHPDWGKPYTGKQSHHPGCKYVAVICRPLLITWAGSDTNASGRDAVLRAEYKSHIKQHHSRVHLKEKNFQCHLCHYKTFKKYDLQKHMKTHTKDGHDIKKCDDCGQQQLHIKTGRRKRIQTPAAAAAVRLSEKPNQLRDSDSDNGSESSARSQRNQCPDVSVPHCTSSRRSDIGESGRNCTAKSQPNGPTCSFSWDKRCHVCCKEFVFENNLQLHMLSHKKEGHDMVRCEYCRVHLACTQRTGCRSRVSLVVDSRLLVIEQPVDDEGEDDTENQESGSKEMDMNDDGDGDSDSRSSHDRDDGMSSHMADEGKGAPAATGIFQKMINRCTRFCRNLTNHKSWTGNAAAGSR